MKFAQKGGVWLNTEDEVLKAAVMKYGKNEWSRIASLLVRKTAKQCKARWYEWLDPSIKKSQWTKEEDEKLLYYARMMPCQWRTIAPLIGRTAQQCLEQYSKLLDVAQGRESDEKTPIGDQDVSFETKPARPDAVDMEEDELEMLSEARARLANTKGKKAKRKARERQLKEARRLATLQKRRELKAAGIDVDKDGNLLSEPKKKDKLFVDYNAEIPFQRLAPKGIYDTSKEDAVALDQRIDPEEFKGADIELFEGKKRSQREAEAREKDLKRQKLQKEINLPEYLERIKKLTGTSSTTAAKPQLELPAPKSEMRVKNSTGTLPVLSHQDRMLRDAQDLIALTNASTPLTGGENPVLNSTKTDSQSIKTTVGINEQIERSFFKRDITVGLKSLPKPKNEYDIVPQSSVPVQREEVKTFRKDDVELDAIEKRKLESKEKEEMRKFQSSALQLNLPIPESVDAFVVIGMKEPAKSLVAQNALERLHHDLVDPSSNPKASEFSLDELETARSLILAEMNVFPPLLLQSNVKVDTLQLQSSLSNLKEKSNALISRLGRIQSNVLKKFQRSPSADINRWKTLNEHLKQYEMMYRLESDEIQRRTNVSLFHPKFTKQFWKEQLKTAQITESQLQNELRQRNLL